VKGAEQHSGFAMEIETTLDDDLKPNIEVSAASTDVEVDAETLVWLTELLPNVGEIVTALEPRGFPFAAFDCSWSQADGFDWCLLVEPNGINVTYRGILDDEGQRFSFPYPATDCMGSVVASSDGVLFHGQAVIGGSGSANAVGIIDFREPSFLDIDIKAREVPLDQRVSHAITGNPVIANLWRELGSPDQGLADADVEIRYVGDEFLIRVAGNAADISVLPSILPIRADVDHAWFDWVPGKARFGASMHALGGGIWVDGSAHDVVNRDVPEIRLTLRGRGFDATHSELRILESYLPLPQGLSEFELSGDVFYDLHLVKPLDETSPAHISGQLVTEGANLRWPALGLDFIHLYSRAGFAGHGADMQIGVARSWSQVDGGTVNGSLMMTSAGANSKAVAEGRQLRLSNDLLSNLQDLSGQKPWGRHLEWQGSVNMLAEVDPFQPTVIESHMDFHPLVVRAPGMVEDVTFEIGGRIEIGGEMTPNGSNFPFFNANAITLTGAGVDLSVQDLSAFFDDTGLQVEAVCGSSAGIELSSRLPQLVDEETMLALEEIGLGGMVRPNNLQVLATLPYDDPMHFRANGGLIMEDVTLAAGASPLTNGYAEIEVRDARWNGAQDFAAELEFSNGSAKVGGLAMEHANAHVDVNPDRVIWTDVNAEMLGGRLHTNGSDADGTEVSGLFRLDFDPSAPMQANYFVTGMQLERMRDELGLGGPLAGVVSGFVDVTLPSTSPTFASGRGWFHINGGALGTVPVLKTIWRVAGISPPIFDEGDVAFRLNGQGRLYVDEFSLQHPLLRVTGEGSMDMDTRLRLKVTLRTFGFVGRLPILKDLIDLLIEQQVYGPAEAPIITHRAGGKLFGDDFAPPPFPLWVPGGPQPDWRISPIFPVE